MTKERMIELVLLNQLDAYLNSLDEYYYLQFKRKYDITKIQNRSKELTDEFLSKYAIDNGVTTN